MAGERSGFVEVVAREDAVNVYDGYEGVAIYWSELPRLIADLTKAQERHDQRTKTRASRFAGSLGLGRPDVRR
jgi:hypothetical protein